VYSNGFAIVTPTAGVYSYSITGTNTTGCVGVPAISSLTVSPNPTLSISATKTVICKGNSSTITVSGADTYQWVNGPATAANPITPTATAMFTVTGTSAEGCSKTGMISIMVDLCVGIDENSSAVNNIMVYPNPSTGEFTVSTPSKVTVLIYDVQGKVVYEQALEQGSHVINMSQAGAGQYLLKAAGDAKAKSVVLIKE
jgi:uncharacterized membrane protein